MHTISKTACLLALTALSFVFASGGKSEAATAPTKEAPAQVTASSSVDKDAYTVKITAPSSCKSGSECKATVKVSPKGEYHINDKYPVKFTTATAADGLSYTKTTLKKDDGSFSEKEGSLPVGFTSSKAGKVSVGGTLSVGFCKAEACLMEKVELAVDVDVK